MGNTMELGICPICNTRNHVVVGRHPDLELIATEGLIYFCKVCSFGFTSPLPSDDDLQRFYFQHYRAIRNEHVDDFYVQRCIIRSQSHIALLKKFFTSFENIKVLEIGSGIGTTLSILSSFGAVITGYEADINFATYSARQLPKARIINKYFKAGCDLNKYDLIIMSHTLEHILNPFQFLDDLRSNLTTKGIVFIEVPNENIKTIKALVDKKIIGNMHLNYFTYKSFKKFNNDKFEILFNRTCGILNFFHPFILPEFVKRFNFFIDLNMFNHVNRYSDDGRIWSRVLLRNR